MGVNINISKKHLIVFLIIVGIATVLNYVIAQVPSGYQGHEANEIYPGTFQEGTYNFTQGSSKIVADEICLPDVGSCETSWPSGGGGAFVVTAQQYTSTNCGTLCDVLERKICAFGVGGSKLESCTDTFSDDRVVRCACWP